MREVDSSAILERLKHSIQLLACAPEIQLKLLPDFVCKADARALKFDHWKGVVLDTLGAELSAEQKSRIESIDRNLSDLTNAGTQHWTENAVRESEE